MRWPIIKFWDTTVFVFIMICSVLFFTILSCFSRVDCVPLSTRAPSTGVIPSLSGGPISIGSGTYPRANRLADGSFIAGYTAVSGGNNIITLARSTDNGASWNEVGTAATRPSATSDLDNPYPLQLPSGRLLVAYRDHDRTSPTDYTYYRIVISSSDDNGATWTYLSTPAQDPAGPNGNWEPFLRNAEDGSLQIFYSRENSAADQDSLMRTSTDGGATWSDATTISGASTTNTRDGMIGVATVNGPNLLAVFETESGGLFTINSITSSDDGLTYVFSPDLFFISAC